MGFGYSHFFPQTYPCDLSVLEADMVIVNSTPYLSLLLCFNLLFMCMHKTCIFYSSHMHWSLSSTLGCGGYDGDRAMQRGGISERMRCYWMTACYLNKSSRMKNNNNKKQQGHVMRNTYCQGIPVQSFQYFGESQRSCSSHDGLITLQKTATAAEHLCKSS